jgi:hypothetical protein
MRLMEESKTGICYPVISVLAISSPLYILLTPSPVAPRLIFRPDFRRLLYYFVLNDAGSHADWATTSPYPMFHCSFQLHGLDVTNSRNEAKHAFRLASIPK